MPAETTHFKIKYSIAADETKAFPAEVSKPGAETIDKALWEGNKVAAGLSYGAQTGRTVGTEYEPSATRAVFVTVKAQSKEHEKLSAEATVGGKVVAGFNQILCEAGENTVTVTLAFIVPAGQKWKVAGATIGSLQSSYLEL